MKIPHDDGAVLAKEAAISPTPRRRTYIWTRLERRAFRRRGRAVLKTWSDAPSGPRLWFTIGYGIINEVYWPRIDIPQIRYLGFVVADEKGFWVDVKRGGQYQLRSIAPGVPAYEITHSHSRFTLRLRITPDRCAMYLQSNVALRATIRRCALMCCLLPTGATGYGNRATIAEHRGRRFLSAERSPFAMALAAVDQRQQDAIMRTSAGYVGASDGWQDFARNGRMAWEYPAAGPGNVALLAELPR